MTTDPEYKTAAVKEVIKETLPEIQVEKERQKPAGTPDLTDMFSTGSFDPFETSGSVKESVPAGHKEADIDDISDSVFLDF